MHKKIIFDEINNTMVPAFTVHGLFMGSVDEMGSTYPENIQDTFRKHWDEGAEVSFSSFMRGVVGPCIIEVLFQDKIWFFSSCASSGFYWTSVSNEKSNNIEYLLSNEEGVFFREALGLGCELSEGAVINTILSHHSVSRPIFTGLLKDTYRCPPGFSLEISSQECKLNTFILNKTKKTRKQQDGDLRKNFSAVADIYKTYIKKVRGSASVAFSGGVDSTALILLHKSCSGPRPLAYYIDRGKIAEKKMASEITRRSRFKFIAVKPDEGFSAIDARRRAATGLATLNGIAYMEHGFRYFPLQEGNGQVSRFVITGQNSDTMFHIDHYAATSYSTGLYRFLIMMSGILPRFRKTILYYKLSQVFEKNVRNAPVPPGVLESYTGLSEHGSKGEFASKEVNNLFCRYKYKHYVYPLMRWLKSEVYPELIEMKYDYGHKINHVARLARWLRTISSFHQQFSNIGKHENIVVCTPFSEGPVATDLLSYRLGFMDVLFPKRFLHALIRDELGVSYAKVRSDTLGGWSKFSVDLIDLLMKLAKRLTKLVQRRRHNGNFISVNPPRSAVSFDQLRNLREVLGHTNGVVKRPLLNYGESDAYRSYLSYLYDCIDLRVDPGSISRAQGNELCRLVNLQVMLDV